MDEQKRKAILNRWKNSERGELLAGMPIAPERLDRLLDYLDVTLVRPHDKADLEVSSDRDRGTSRICQPRGIGKGRYRG